MLDVTIDSGVSNGMQDPDLLRRLDEATHAIPEINTHGITAGKAICLADVLKEAHRRFFKVLQGIISILNLSIGFYFFHLIFGLF